MLVNLHNLITACVTSTIPCSVSDVSVDGGCLYVISAVWKAEGRGVCGLKYLRFLFSVVEFSECKTLIMWFEVYTLLCDLVYANYGN